MRTRLDGVTTCSPIWDWHVGDIWAYHHRHGIEPNPLYKRMEELGVPEKGRRVSLAVGSDGSDRGRLVWLKRGWPDLWQRYCVALPRLREKG